MVKSSSLFRCVRIFFYFLVYDGEGDDCNNDSDIKFILKVRVMILTMIATLNSFILMVRVMTVTMMVMMSMIMI